MLHSYVVEIRMWQLHDPKFFGAAVGGPSGVTYAFVNPPSTTKSVAFTKLLSSLARKTTACACSIASPNLPVGK